MDEPLTTITEALEQHRHDAMLIVQSQLLRAALHPHVGDFGHAGFLVLQWAQDSVLAGCRRLLDDTASARSLSRTLRALRAEASTRV